MANEMSAREGSLAVLDYIASRVFLVGITSALSELPFDRKYSGISFD